MDPIQNTLFRLKDVLGKLGVSQRKLARLAHLDQEQISRIHNDKNLPSWGTAAKIARALGVSVGVFLEGDPEWMRFFTRSNPDVPPASTTRIVRGRRVPLKGKAG